MYVYFLVDYLACENSIGCSFLFCGGPRLPFSFLCRYNEIWKCLMLDYHIALGPHVMRATLLQDELNIINALKQNWKLIVLGEHVLVVCIADNLYSRGLFPWFQPGP